MIALDKWKYIGMGGLAIGSILMGLQFVIGMPVAYFAGWDIGYTETEQALGFVVGFALIVSGTSLQVLLDWKLDEHLEERYGDSSE